MEILVARTLLDYEAFGIIVYIEVAVVFGGLLICKRSINIQIFNFIEFKLIQQLLIGIFYRN